jgi:hypothetical protein
MTESQFQRQVIKALEDFCAVVYNIHGHAMQKRGIPDLYVAHRLWTGWIELKVGGNSISAIQAHQLEKLWSAGAQAFVVRLNGGVLVRDVEVPWNDPKNRGMELLRVLRKLGET